MRNFRLVFTREYTTRFRSKFFWIGTFLAPIGLVVITALPILVMSLSSGSRIDVQVVDPTGLVFPHLQNNELVTYNLFQGSPDSLRKAIEQNERIAGLILPSDLGGELIQVSLKAQSPPSLSTEMRIHNAVEAAVQHHRYTLAGVSQAQLDSANFRLHLRVQKISAEGESESNSVLASGVGYAMAMLIYIMIAIYGSMVMKGVLEEKTNRIMEVMASSVKPFDLLFGKVTAVGAIGITQIVLWGILLLALSSALMPLLVGAEVPDPQAISGLQATPQQPTPGEVSNVISALRSFNFAILLFFPIFFIGGFLVYGSLYAGLAASADQESDVQALSFLVFFPLIITVILMGAVIENPNGGLALFMSLFPLFSPIIMPLRMAATDVPMWQTLLSILLLCGGVVGLVALASRIYRAGMLIYGQKPSLKTLYRWVIRGQ